MEAMTQVCDPHLMDTVKLKSPPTPGKEFDRIVREIALNDFLLFTKFRGEVSAGSHQFQQTVTDDGVCYTFNGVESHEMFKEATGSSNKTWDWRKLDIDEFDVYPHRAFAGAETGFNVVLNLVSSDLDFICRGPVQGYKVKIHSPDEHPRMSGGYIRVPLNVDVSISVKPEVSIDSAGVGSTCHSTATKSLQYFKEYSHKNCISECLSSHVLDKCGCVKFSMVHNSETKVCDQQSTKCVTEAANEFATKTRFKSDFPCDCKPTCKDLSYQTKVSQAEFDFTSVFKVFKEDLAEFPEAIMSRLVVYVEDEFFVPSVTMPKDSVVDLIARIGGIAAFFLGASWISIIEVCFYLVRRFVF